MCKGSTGCVDLAERRKAFGRALRAPVEAAAVATLRAELAERARIEAEEQEPEEQEPEEQKRKD